MISVTILTKNSNKYLNEVLEALKDVNEVVIYDNGSEDNTIEIAKRFKNTSIYQGTFEGFGPTHNKASSLAKNDWILSIDSDEVASKKMIQEVLSLDLDDTFVYSFPRHNYFNKRFIKWCGWYPDRQVRLYNRKKTKFSNAQVHEAIICANFTEIKLNSPLIHYSYQEISDFLAKMQVYSSLFAEQNQGKKHSSPWKAITHGMFAFFKSYFIKRGIFGGYEGFLISIYNGHTAFYKYTKLYEANKKRPLS